MTGYRPWVHRGIWTWKILTFQHYELLGEYTKLIIPHNDTDIDTFTTILLYQVKWCILPRNLSRNVQLASFIVMYFILLLLYYVISKINTRQSWYAMTTLCIVICGKMWIPKGTLYVGSNFVLKWRLYVYVTVCNGLNLWKYLLFLFSSCLLKWNNIHCSFIWYKYFII